MASRQDVPHCSFCGKPAPEVGRLIAGPDVHICSACVGVCNQVLAQEPAGAAGRAGAARKKTAAPKLVKPHELKARLDEYVIGQEYAKKVLSVAVHNHYKRLHDRQQGAAAGADQVELEKSNILLLGPTGTGKTLLARTLARILDVPFSISDATTLTEAGYVGEDVENILLRLIQAADGDVARAEQGIVYVDEIDKIGRKTDNVSITRDVSGEGVQQALLKILEGTIASVPTHGGRKHPQAEYIKINTEHILFICGGAFVGVEQIIQQRLGKGTIGFLHPQRQKAPVLRVEPEDLLKFGLIPEFVGRLPIVTALEALDEEALVRVLTEPKNAITRQYAKLLAMEGVELSFTPGALRELARQAVQKGTGARGLRAILEHLMLDVMYEVPQRGGLRECRITQAVVQGRRSVLATDEQSLAQDEELRPAV